MKPKRRASPSETSPAAPIRYKGLAVCGKSFPGCIVLQRIVAQHWTTSRSNQIAALDPLPDSERQAEYSAQLWWWTEGSPEAPQLVRQVATECLGSAFRYSKISRLHCQASETGHSPQLSAGPLPEPFRWSPRIFASACAFGYTNSWPSVSPGQNHFRTAGGRPLLPS